MSDHELAQGYETVTDPSVYVQFPLTSGPWAGASMIVWTTTPWTLVSNTAVAVNPDVAYVLAEVDGERRVVAEPLLAAVLGEAATVIETVRGTEMERWTYQRPFDLVDIPGSHFVVLADYVTTADGSGLVHQAPAFGADDMAVCKTYGLPVVNPIAPDGHFNADVRLVGGQFFKEADAALVADLRTRGLLFKKLDYEHSYPHCWRCHTPLMYFALPAWYIRTTARSAELLAENEKTNWYPETVKHGRYGEWLRGNIDWSLSRNRYWGTPLPIWRNDADPSALKCIGSLAELSELTGRDVTDLDPHRPYIDDITFEIEGEPGTYRRVPEVIDVWYDSGAMPFAQHGYPHVPGSIEKFEQAYPAQYICEAIDQTRGWFYSLMAVGTMVFDQSSYENVVCLGHIMAEDGKKMSKHLGNILLPMPLMDEHGADALRWFMAASGSPWSARRIGNAGLTEIVRKVILTYWNTVAFHALYTRAEGWSPADGAPPVAERQVLDRWLLSELHQLTGTVTQALENFDTHGAGTAIATFIDTVSNWYVRRSRKRFWRGDTGAFATLHEVLDVLTRLMAPLTPFVTERVWQDIVRPSTPDAPASVHLATWPIADASLIDTSLTEQMDVVRRLTELGRAARAEAKVRTRQPLRRALVSSAHHALLGPDLTAELCEELNIGEVGSLAEAGADLVEFSAKANFRALGKKYGKETPRAAAAVAAADATWLASALTHGEVTVTSEDGSTWVVDAEDVIVSERPRDGWSVLNSAGETIALDLSLDEALVAAGQAREVVRAIQEGRKNAGLDITDRIEVTWAADGALAEAIRTHTQAIADEVLAVAFTEGAVAGGVTDDGLGLTFAISKS